MIRTYTVVMMATLLAIALSGCYVEEDRDHDRDRALYQQDLERHDMQGYDMQNYDNPDRDHDWHPEG